MEGLIPIPFLIKGAAASSPAEVVPEAATPQARSQSHQISSKLWQLEDVMKILDLEMQLVQILYSITQAVPKHPS